MNSVPSSWHYVIAFSYLFIYLFILIALNCLLLMLYCCFKCGVLECSERRLLNKFIIFNIIFTLAQVT